ncbi:hypothetical protein D9M70_583180 [compost metagenome]
MHCDLEIHAPCGVFSLFPNAIVLLDRQRAEDIKKIVGTPGKIGHINPVQYGAGALLSDGKVLDIRITKNFLSPR